MMRLHPFGEPSLCHHVSRELMRNPLLDLTPIILATACHQRNCVETYSRSSRRAGLWSDPQAQVPLNGQCKAAGCNTSEPKVASSYGPAPADRIVAPGRLTGSGDEWT